MANEWWGSKAKTIDKGPQKTTVGPDVAYKVLEADLIRGPEKERATAIASFVRCEADAHKLAGHDGFTYCTLDTLGRVGVVRDHGREVALLFKRQVLKITPGPADPVPERVLKNPDDEWIQISLLNTDEVTQQKGIGDKLRQAMASVDRLRALWKSEEANAAALQEKLDKLAGAKEKLAAAEERALLLEKQLEGTQKEIDSLKREVQQQKEGRKADKKSMVEEIFPVFNTVWLAGVHRVNDQLYTMLRKQMTEALGKIGITLIEPQLGEKFDPEQHHAVHSQEVEEESRQVDCITRIQKVGWKMGNLVVSAAEVAVGVEKRRDSEDSAVAQEQQRGV